MVAHPGVDSYRSGRESRSSSFAETATAAAAAGADAAAAEASMCSGEALPHSQGFLEAPGRCGIG